MKHELNKILYGQFYENFSEGIFLDESFNDLIKDVLKFFKTESQLNLRNIALLWEFNLNIQILIKSHYNGNDIYKIKGIDIEADYQITNILLYICNSLSFNKEIELSKIELGSWN